MAHVFDKPIVDAEITQLAHQCARRTSDQHARQRHQEHQAEQQTPQRATNRAGAVALADVDPTVLLANNARPVRQVSLAPADLAELLDQLLTALPSSCSACTARWNTTKGWPSTCATCRSTKPPALQPAEHSRRPA